MKALRGLVGICIAVVGAGCSDPSGPSEPLQVAVSLSPTTVPLDGTAQATTTVTRGGKPLTGQSVSYSSENPSIATVNSSGVVTGVGMGTTRILAKVTSGQSGAATLSVGPGAPATIAKGAGDQQTALPRDPVAIPPAVIVRDRLGNPVPGVPVIFSVVMGGGSLAGSNATTDASGTATVGSWTLGALGANTITAMVS